MPSSTDETRAAAGPDEIYVGYLPVPPGQKRFLKVVVPLVLGALGFMALALAWTQPDPGGAVWDDGRLRTFEGTLRATPYPMLEAEDRGDGKPGTLLIVEVGKFSGGQRAAPFDGQRVTISGWLLHRDERFMIELEPGEGAISPAGGAPAPAPEARRLGRMTLRGEIVDSKCYLGAMKPGTGKTHKECAILCVTGGIPPSLVTRDESGAMTFYLLEGADGGALDEAAYPFIADPVEVTGEVEERAGLLRLRVSTSDIRRL
ncbi:MAG: hypothetical protein SFY69_10580 [Planctomycetota bacterium]|nr:hypothetical protein [Planctomycetota bacterium]